MGRPQVTVSGVVLLGRQQKVLTKVAVPQHHLLRVGKGRVVCLPESTHPRAVGPGVGLTGFAAAPENALQMAPD